MGVLSIRKPKTAQQQKETYHFPSIDLEWKIQMMQHTQKSLAIIDHQQEIQSKNIGIESQGEGVGIQD